MSKSKIFLYLQLSFIGGVLVRSFWAPSLVFIWVLVLVGISAVVLGLIKNKKVLLVGFLILFFGVGVWRMETAAVARPDLASWYEKRQTFQGVIWEEPIEKEKTNQFKIKIFSVEDQTLAKPFFVLVTNRRYPTYQLGDELEIKGILRPPENYSDFDKVSYLARQDIFAVIDYPLIEKTGEKKIGIIESYLNHFKKSFEENIDQSLPEPHAAFLKGLLLGDRSSLPSELVNDFKIAGVSHIVALSGYNITLVGKFFIVILAALSIPFYLSFWVAVAGLILFVIMVGASASVVRAAIMGILVLLAQKEGRLYNITNALILAGAIMVFQNPRILISDTAFQLSFLATAGLVYLSPMVENFLELISRFFKNKFSEETYMARGLNTELESKQIFSLKRILVETLSAQLMVLPLLIYVFGRVSLISPLTNILVLSAIPWSMILGFATGMAGFLSTTLGSILGWVVWILLEYQIKVIEFFASVPGASIELPSWSIFIVLIIYLCFGWKLLKKYKKPAEAG